MRRPKATRPFGSPGRDAPPSSNEPTGTTPTKHLAHRTSKWMVEETTQKYEETDTEHRYCQRIHSAVSTRILQVTAVGVSVKLAKPNVVRWTKSEAFQTRLKRSSSSGRDSK